MPGNRSVPTPDKVKDTKYDTVSSVDFSKMGRAEAILFRKCSVRQISVLTCQIVGLKSQQHEHLVHQLVLQKLHNMTEKTVGLKDV